jgi:hypothetical protein
LEVTRIGEREFRLQTMDRPDEIESRHSVSNG